MNLADLRDDSDLPPAEQPRDPANGRYQSPAPRTPQQPETPAEPPARQHSPYFLTSAQHLGIPPEVAKSMTPEALERVVASLQARQPAPAREAAPDPEPAVDWGDDDEGKPLSEEQARKLYSRPVFAAIKAAHDLPKVQKQLEQERGERRAERYHSALDQLFRSRPDVFGAKAPKDPFSPEARKRRQVESELAALVQAKRHTTLEDDWSAIVADLYGGDAEPAAKPAKPQPNPAAAYAKGELARPTGRKTADTRSYRERRIEEVSNQMRENGQHVAPVTDDDADLPAYDYDRPRH